MLSVIGQVTQHYAKIQGVAFMYLIYGIHSGIKHLGRIKH